MQRNMILHVSRVVVDLGLSLYSKSRDGNCMSTEISKESFKNRKLTTEAVTCVCVCVCVNACVLAVPCLERGWGPSKHQEGLVGSS
jgi:hypothetical protein